MGAQVPELVQCPYAFWMQDAAFKNKLLWYRTKRNGITAQLL